MYDEMTVSISERSSLTLSSYPFKIKYSSIMSEQEI